MRAKRKCWQEFGPLPNYERCFRFEIEEKVGVIIIHNTTLGPALGGFRIKPYSSEAEMIGDAARLARGMSYKNAASGFDLGGGKAAVNATPEELTPKFLRKYGEVVEELNGKYITAPDFGSGVKMMDIISQSTEHVVCLSEKNGGLGDPSPSTAHGVFLSLDETASFGFGCGLKDIRIIIQGYGKVGEPLAKECRSAGAKVLISETAEDRAAAAKEACFELIPQDKVFAIPARIFSPNATGAIFNPETIRLLKKQKVQLICGGANNQLANEERDNLLLHKAKILWLPDFIVNAGGVAIAYTEWQARTKKIGNKKIADFLEERLQKIARRVKKIIQRSIGRDLPTLTAAQQLAEEIVADRGGRLR